MYHCGRLFCYKKAYWSPYYDYKIGGGDRKESDVNMKVVHNAFKLNHSHFMGSLLAGEIAGQ